MRPVLVELARRRRLGCMNIKRLLATAAMTAGLAIGLAATAGATAEDDFWECVGDHQDTDGIGVCCVFYGGTYDERSGECWDYPEATDRAGRSRPEDSPEKACAHATAQPPGNLRRLAPAARGRVWTNRTVTSAPACIKSTLGPRACQCSRRCTAHPRHPLRLSGSSPLASPTSDAPKTAPTACRTRSPRPRFPPAPSGVAGCSTGS